MPARSYHPEDLVELPVRDTDDALNLAAKLHTAAAHYQKPEHGKPRTLPPLIADALADIEATRAELEKEAAPVAARPRTIKAADLVEDNAVGALSDWSKSFLRLPEGTPARVEAAEVHAAF